MEAWVKASSAEYRNGWDRTFGKKDPMGTTCPDEVHDFPDGGPWFTNAQGLRTSTKCRRCGVPHPEASVDER